MLIVFSFLNISWIFGFSRFLFKFFLFLYSIFALLFRSSLLQILLMDSRDFCLEFSSYNLSLILLIKSCGDNNSLDNSFLIFSNNYDYLLHFLVIFDPMHSPYLKYGIYIKILKRYMHLIFLFIQHMICNLLIDILSYLF